MGKSGYKRFKKQEKAKVKLKGNKTLLPKGQNVTDTAFKVKKIVVREQLKQHGEQELLTKKHLNAKELISRLNHHNVTMRQEAVGGLKELILIHDRTQVLANLATLLQAVMPLTIDKDSNVRSANLKLLSAIFNNVSEKQLSPLFSMVVSHMACAMTHIDPAVRADSLLLLDTMLATLPSLTAAHTPTLLPHFLNLISQRSDDKGHRTLSLHLDGHLTSEKWRYRVIGRLNRLFSVIWDLCNKVENKEARTVRWLPNQRLYLRLFSPIRVDMPPEEDVNDLPVKDYTELLLPLLLDTVTEAVPKQNQEIPDSGCVIGVDTAALLQNIVEVIIHLRNMLGRSPQADDMREWFKNTWGRQVAKRLVEGRFPYSVSGANSRKRKHDTKKLLVALQMSGNPSCTLLNLQLCLLTFLVSSPGPLWLHSIEYIKCVLRNEDSMKPEEVGMVCQCLEAATHNSVDGCPTLLSVIAKSKILTQVDKPKYFRAFEFLSSIALKYSHPLHQNQDFCTWLDSLPGFLCKASLPLPVVQRIASIATTNRPAFANSLNGWIEAILENLPRLTVTKDNEDEGHRLVVGLVYWISEWDQSLVDTVNQLVQQGSLGPTRAAHLVDLLKFKMDRTENKEIKDLLEQILPPPMIPP